MTPTTAPYSASDGMVPQVHESRGAKAGSKVRLLGPGAAFKTVQAIEPRLSPAVVISMFSSTATATPLTPAKARATPRAKARMSGGAMT